jgi:gliding motility-associated-like protein
MEGKTDMIKLFAERFAEHEMPAPDGAWEAISSQLTLNAAADADHVTELFRDRFAEHTVEVDPSVWSNISGQLGHVGTASGWASVAAWAGAGVAALVLTGAVVWLNQEDPPTVAERPIVVQQETPGITGPMDPTMEPTQEGSRIPPVPVPSTHDQGTPVPAPPHDGPATSVIPQIILNEMAEEAKEEPLKPETRAEDPRLEEEARPIQLPPVMVEDRPPTTQTPSVPDHPSHPDATASDRPMEQESDESEDPTGPLDQEPGQPFSLYLPNVFTPNGDGINDEYRPEGDGHAAVKIRVYSMTNNQELVFAADEARAWNGTYFNGGQQCPEGMYLYAVEVIDAAGRAHTEGRVVNLLR